MTEQEATKAIALAGRELGGGPAVAVSQLVPGVKLSQIVLRIQTWQSIPEELKDSFPLDESKIEILADTYAYGMAVGLLMAEESVVMRKLSEIESEWRENK